MKSEQRTGSRPLHEGRTALVTGGASGIGAAIARDLAAQGARVTIADRDENGARTLADEIGGNLWAVDLSDGDSLASHPLEVDILVNNAGVQHVSPIHEFDPQMFRRMLALMVEAPFLLIRSALPYMYSNGFGRIINVSSIHGLRASANKAAYVAAKHALEGLSKTTALEGGLYGVTSNCVNPAYVRTPLVERQIADQARVHGVAESDVITKVMLVESAIDRLIEPHEVAALVSFLAGKDAAMITGASYTMDGGWSAR
ncbi:3-hydroxybutyrate dehydrogenase [Rhodococcus sp. SMB37]|uniref:3-hydroxybutyrate dehydrogenase n=1 Tax=Rhodococcus sp. SMB37 TaxID=2512213 RepID=UPI001043B0BB|nr:3-hydroxybutyrate dehydrogenase [Rhodococcus sp. SMB37]